MVTISATVFIWEFQKAKFHFIHYDKFGVPDTVLGIRDSISENCTN